MTQLERKNKKSCRELMLVFFFALCLLIPVPIVSVQTPYTSEEVQEIEHTDNETNPLYLERGVDDDHDGVADWYEDELLHTYAPVVLLWADEANPVGWCEIDAVTWPCSVDWFLVRSHMRFHHNGCSDCEIIAHGLPTQTNIVSQQHKKKRDWYYLFCPCCHYDNWERSWCDFDEDQCFFLQLYNPSHTGSSNSEEWMVYGHVYPNTYNGVNIQYWFFYAYNDGWNCHEGDWEHIVLQLNENLDVVEVVFCHHGTADVIASSDMTWYETTHPVVLSAGGSHASYHNFEACNNANEPGCAWCTPVESCDNAWFTWDEGKPSGSPGFQGGGVVNVGETSAPLHNQYFIQYSGRWGEIGEFDFTSGPRGPAYHTSGPEAWNLHRSSTPNQPPYAPSNPSPSNGATTIPAEMELEWSASDPEGQTLTYDVYLGHTTSPPCIAHNISTSSFRR
jgi:hypothetical protein